MSALPSPLELLWLAATRDDDPAGVRQRLLPCLESAPVRDLEFTGEVLGVYTGVAEHTAPECRQALVHIKADYIRRSVTHQRLTATPGDFIRCNRLSGIILGISRTCPFAAYGDSYIYAVLTLQCDCWRVAVALHPRPPYAEMAEQYGEHTNDHVRPLLREPIKSVLSNTDLRAPESTARELAAACATVCEICAADGPVVYCNMHVSIALARAAPSICLFSEEFQGACGARAPACVLHGGVMYYDDTASIAQLLVFWLHCAFESAPPGSPLWELGRAVLQGIAGSLSNRAGLKPSELKAGAGLDVDAPEGAADGDGPASGD